MLRNARSSSTTRMRAGAGVMALANRGHPMQRVVCLSIRRYPRPPAQTLPRRNPGIMGCERLAPLTATIRWPLVPMRAAIYWGKGDLRVEEVPVPEPGPGEMLVRVEACGICGTDIKKIEKGLLPGPRIFGHEICGTVARLGAGTQRFREGDRVVVHHHVPCRRCFYCAQQAYAQCESYKRNGTTAGFEAAGGGMAEYVKALDWIVERGTIAVPDGVSPEEAALVEPVNTCLKAVRKAGVTRGQ